MKNTVITISREYGSGGRDVGRMLAEQLSVPLFDKEIMHMAIERSGLPSDFVERHGENVPNRFFQNLRRLSVNVPSIRIPSGYTSMSMMIAARPGMVKSGEDYLHHVQADAIREAATRGCVIVGRCASYILRDNPNLLSVFIRGDMEDRIGRAVEIYGYNEKNATKDVKKIDRHRANYYHFYTSQKWGAAANYDLVVNTSYTGIEGAVTVIKAMLESKEY
jgi:cytidylate kinase